MFTYCWVIWPVYLSKLLYVINKVRNTIEMRR